MSDKVQRESQSGGIYLVEYSEDLWYDLPDATKDHCRSEWIKKATAMKEVRFVVLKLLPDDLFPMHGHELPYVHWQHAIDRGNECGYTYAAGVGVKLNKGTEFTPLLRSRIESELREKFPKGTVWQVWSAADQPLQELAHGRL